MGIITHSELLLSPEGRITRAQWWYGALLLNGGIILAWWLERLSFAATPVLHVLLPIVFILLAYPAYCLHSKRFQDRDRHYGYAAALVVLQLAGIILLVSDHRSLEQGGLFLLAGLGLWSAVELGLLKGTDGSNRFGHVPGVSQPRAEEHKTVRPQTRERSIGRIVPASAMRSAATGGNS